MSSAFHTRSVTIALDSDFLALANGLQRQRFDGRVLVHGFFLSERRRWFRSLSFMLARLRIVNTYPRTY